MSEVRLDEDDVLPEYDLSQAKPSPYPELFRERGVRMLEPDVRDAFPDSQSVNAALRLLLRAVRAIDEKELPKAS